MEETRGEPITAEGLAALKEEIAELEGPGRTDMAERIKAARELGDLKENAEYHIAKDDQALLETRISGSGSSFGTPSSSRPRRRQTFGFGRTAVIEEVGFDTGTSGPWSARPRPTSRRGRSRPSRRSARR